jgi:hypothetical protein
LPRLVVERYDVYMGWDYSRLNTARLQGLITNGQPADSKLHRQWVKIHQ